MPSHDPASGSAPAQAMQGSSPAPVSAAENRLSASSPVKRADSPAEARGRRILSTAFVRVGPDGQLTVELQGGRVLVLRDVVMHARDYCGTPVSGAPGKRWCGDYAGIAAARPGGGPVPDLSVPAAANPAPPARARVTPASTPRK